MEKIKVATNAISNMTVLQGLTDLGRPATIIEIKKVLKIPDTWEFNLAQKVSNMIRYDYVKSERSRANVAMYSIQPAGTNLIQENLHKVQEYGDYDAVPVHKTKGNRKGKGKPVAQPQQELELNVSPALKAAMDELAVVAAGNEHATKACHDLLAVIDRYELLEVDIKSNQTGALKLVQDETKKMDALLRSVKDQVSEIIGA